MFETAVEIQDLQALIDQSFADAGAHLLSILTPERRLSARQVVAYLQGVKQIALATAMSSGEPRVSPVDALFLHGRFVFGSGAESLRFRHIRRRPSVSLVHMVGDELAITVHGRAEMIALDSPAAKEIDAVWQQVYGFSPLDPESWTKNGLSPDIGFARVEPAAMFTFAQDPSKYPG